jgi:hypothetical protein
MDREKGEQEFRLRIAGDADGARSWETPRGSDPTGR